MTEDKIMEMLKEKIDEASVEELEEALELIKENNHEKEVKSNL